MSMTASSNLSPSAERSAYIVYFLHRSPLVIANWVRSL